MLNPTHLRTFLGAVEEGSFTGAAQRLGMTQPGVSQHIARLEEELGNQLFIRHPRGIELLPAGQHLLEFVQERERAEQELRHEIGRDDPTVGLCRIASPGSFGLFAYPRLLELQTEHPGLTISFTFAPDGTIRREVHDGEIDMGIVTGVVEDRGLAAEQIAAESLMIVVPATQQDTSLEALTKLGFIGHPDGESHANRALRAHFGERFRGTGELGLSGFSNQIGLILAPVARGLGFTVLPEHAVATSPFRDEVRCLETEQPIRDPIWAVWRGDRRLPARFGRVLESLRSDR